MSIYINKNLELAHPNEMQQLLINVIYYISDFPVINCHNGCEKRSKVNNKGHAFVMLLRQDFYSVTDKV